jgi:hypothetical protein
MGSNRANPHDPELRPHDLDSMSHQAPTDQAGEIMGQAHLLDVANHIPLDVPQCEVLQHWRAEQRTSQGADLDHALDRATDRARCSSLSTAHHEKLSKFS